MFKLKYLCQVLDKMREKSLYILYIPSKALYQALRDTESLTTVVDTQQYTPIRQYTPTYKLVIIITADTQLNTWKIYLP